MRAVRWVVVLGLMAHAVVPAAAEGVESLFVFAVDGADWDFLMPLAVRERVPAITGMMSGGASINLESIKILISPRVWTTLATGKGPREHGIMDWTVSGEDGKPVPITSRLRETKALWNIFSDNGRSSGFIGWLATWPAERVKGFLVSSYMPRGLEASPDTPLKGGLAFDQPDVVYPETLTPQLADFLVDEREIRLAGEGRPLPLEYSTSGETLAVEGVMALQKALSIDETFVGAGEYLFAKYRPNLASVYVSAIDVASHRFYKYTAPHPKRQVTGDARAAFGSVIPWTYINADAQLARCRAAEAPAVTMLVSDHGFKHFRDKNKPHVSGWHRSRTALVAEGELIQPLMTMIQARAIDFAPTILYLSGLPVANDMRGVVVEAMVRPEVLAHRPVARLDVFSYDEVSNDGDERKRFKRRQQGMAAADEDLMDQLKAVGYIDGEEEEL
ncbi:alkaline phosphatase family protein [bacterium]|nr:alkaline phosphatase family protein [candidate division CSSED10-310 bacterium]